MKEGLLESMSEIEMLEANHNADHLYFLLSIPPKMCVGDVVAHIKLIGRVVKCNFDDI